MTAGYFSETEKSRAFVQLYIFVSLKIIQWKGVNKQVVIGWVELMYMHIFELLTIINDEHNMAAT